MPQSRCVALKVPVSLAVGVSAAAHLDWLWGATCAQWVPEICMHCQWLPGSETCHCLWGMQANVAVSTAAGLNCNSVGGDITHGSTVTPWAYAEHTPMSAARQ